MTPNPAPAPVPAANPAPAPDIRALMTGFPTGVTVVTAFATDGTPWGMTCTSLCSVALDPPTVLVCLRRASPTLEAVLESRALAVNLLHAQSRPAAELFASAAKDRFERIAWHPGDHACGPHLEGSAHTVADCQVADVHTVGDHTVVMGRVLAVTRLRPQTPLLYGMRRYGSWADNADETLLSYDFIS